MAKLESNKSHFKSLVSPIKRKWVLLTQSQIQQDVDLMGLEEVDGIGSGPGFMVKDLVNHNSTQRDRLLKNKDG